MVTPAQRAITLATGWVEGYTDRDMADLPPDLRGTLCHAADQLLRWLDNQHGVIDGKANLTELE